MKKAIVIGGGFTGCTWAFLLAKRGFEVILLEREHYLGGGCKTFYYGGHPYTIGPRHLITNKMNIVEFLETITPMRKLEHYILTYVEKDGSFYSYPPHIDDIERMPDKELIYQELDNRQGIDNANNFEDYWIRSVGYTLYNKFVKHYSYKMWQIDSNKFIDDFKFDGKGIKLVTGSKQVSPDWFVGYPLKLNGWDDYFAFTTSNLNIKIYTDVRIEKYDLHQKTVHIDNEQIKSDIIVSSVSVDELFSYELGELPYMGRDFHKLVLPIEYVFPDPIYFIHYSGDEAFTRVVEYKKLTGYKSNSTLLGIEIPSKNKKYYPYPIKRYQELAQNYIKMLPKNVISVGRLGNYKYMDIDDVVDEAFKRIHEI